jgi:hypothetical protein
MIALGSLWKRKPPGREVVRIGRVWTMDESVVAPYHDPGCRCGGLTVRAHPVNGGKYLVADAEWFRENYTQLEAIPAPARLRVAR